MLCVVKRLELGFDSEYLGQILERGWYDEGSSLETVFGPLNNFLGEYPEYFLTIFANETDAQAFIDSHSWLFDRFEYEIIPLASLETT